MGNSKLGKGTDKDQGNSVNGTQYNDQTQGDPQGMYAGLLTKNIRQFGKDGRELGG